VKEVCRLPLEPFISEEDFKNFGIETYGAGDQFDGALVFSPHKAFKEISLTKLQAMMHEKPILIDIKGLYDREEATLTGFFYQTL